jgi:hypothetical protein
MCVLPPPLVRGEDTLAGWREGWKVNSPEDARHSSVLYICKYFVIKCMCQPETQWHLANARQDVSESEFDQYKDRHCLQFGFSGSSTF